MTTTTFFPDWRELVTFAAPRPEPTLLRDEDGFRVLLAGLEPGGQIPAHPERLAVCLCLGYTFALGEWASPPSGKASGRSRRATPMRSSAMP